LKGGKIEVVRAERKTETWYSSHCGVKPKGGTLENTPAGGGGAENLTLEDCHPEPARKVAQGEGMGVRPKKEKARVRDAKDHLLGCWVLPKTLRMDGFQNYTVNKGKGG